MKIETPDWDDSDAELLYLIEDRRPALRVFHGADDAPRLVKHDIHVRLRDEAPAIELDAVPLWIRLRPELGNDPTSDGNPTGDDELLGLSA